MRRFAVIAAAVGLGLPAAAHASVNPQIAGLQVALRANGLYLAQIDGIDGPRTTAAVEAFQRKKHLPVGIADARTRAALGPLGKPLFGMRTLRQGDFGWDVAVLQFLLTRRGNYSGALDGYLGVQTDAALRRYQRSMSLTADGIAGPSTLAALEHLDRRSTTLRATTTLRPSVTVASDEYTVRSGDSLTSIAARFGTSVAALAKSNGLDPAKPIIIGQKLRVTVTRSVAALRPTVDVRPILDAWSARLGVDSHLVRALAWQESGYQTSLVSSAGAVGVLQTLPSTRAYVETVLVGKLIPATVDGDVEVGVYYLKHLLDVFHGNEKLALAGWYQGERAVREHGLYKVTKPFVADVLALRARM